MTDLPTQIAEAWHPCPDCLGVGSYPEAPMMGRCSTCKGTGKVDALPGLKESCPNWVTHRDYHNDPAHVIFDRYADGDEGGDCPVCQGRGWVATQDLAVILDAADKLEDIEITVGKSFTSWEHFGDVYSKGFETGPVQERTLKAIAQALLASGATL